MVASEDAFRKQVGLVTIVNVHLHSAQSGLQLDVVVVVVVASIFCRDGYVINENL
jgi:hypothetical protein